MPLLRKPPLIAALLMPLMAGTALAEPDEKQVQALHDKACLACHARMYGGDGSKMYTREGRMLSDRTELQQRVASCSAQMNAGWFPEEEEEVAALLNRRYYHFR